MTLDAWSSEARTISRSRSSPDSSLLAFWVSTTPSEQPDGLFVDVDEAP
jgi:hypothetical protein